MKIIAFVLSSLVLFSSQSHAYSYAAAGKEPLLDGWIATSQALSQNQPEKATEILGHLKDELVNLETEADLALVWRLREANSNVDVKAAGIVYSDIFRAIIADRLQQARENIHEYQLAKVHVAKSKRYLDLLLNDIDLLAEHLDSTQKQQANQLIQDCLSALGKPGLFGAGNQPADPAVFDQSHRSLVQLLSAQP